MRICLFLLLAIGRAFAAGTGDANTEISMATSTAGFCMDNDSTKDPELTGLCLSMTDQFNKNECLRETVENIRKRMIKKPGDKDKKGNELETVDIGFSCSADPDDDNKKNLQTLAEKNPPEFSKVVMQYIAMLIAQKSNWNVLKDLDGGPKGPSGLLGLNLGGGNDMDMDNAKYSCACSKKVATTSDQAGVSVPGQSPGPLDGHHVVTCAPYMILKSIEEDGDSGGGEKKPDGKTEKLRGAARIIPELKSSGSLRMTPEEKWRKDKMATYCKQYWKTENKQQGGETNTYKPPAGKDLDINDLKGPASK